MHAARGNKSDTPFWLNMRDNRIEYRTSNNNNIRWTKVYTLCVCVCGRAGKGDVRRSRHPFNHCYFWPTRLFVCRHELALVDYVSESDVDHHGRLDKNQTRNSFIKENEILLFQQFSILFSFTINSILAPEMSDNKFHVHICPQYALVTPTAIRSCCFFFLRSSLLLSACE